MTEVREVLRARLSAAGVRRVAGQAGVDRKTARRYVQAAVDAGLAREGGLGQLTMSWWAATGSLARSASWTSVIWG